MMGSNSCEGLLGTKEIATSERKLILRVVVLNPIPLNPTWSKLV